MTHALRVSPPAFPIRVGRLCAARWGATRPQRLVPCALLSVLFALPAAAQDDEESELARVQRDQARVGLRLQTLREKFERLAERYDAEGRTRNAQLLREALLRFDQDALLERARHIEQSLEASVLSAVDEQGRLVTSLETIYAVLRDRRDVDELQTRADLLRQALGELGHMITDQGKLAEQSRSVSDTPAGLVDAALGAAERLARALETARGAVEQIEQAAPALGEAALVEWLAAAQRELAARPGAKAAEQEALGQATEELGERLERPLAGADAAEQLLAAQASRAAAAEHVRRASQAMTAAAERLQAAEAAAPAAPAESAEPLGEPKAAPSGGEGGSAAQPREVGPHVGETGGETGAGGGETGAESAGEASATSAGETSAEVGAEASNETGATAGPPSAEPLPEPTGAPPADPAPAPAPAGEPSAAQRAMDEAARHLDAARDELLEAERAASAASNRAGHVAETSSAMAGEQGEDLRDATQRLETLQPEEGPELLDRTRALLEELARFQDGLERRRASDAAAALAGATLDLNEILRQLRERRASASDEPPASLDPGQVAELSAEQSDLGRRLRELMERLEELPEGGHETSGQRAGQAMDAAGSALERRDFGEASTRQEESAEQLEEMRQQLAGERDRYEQLRQEEVLFRLGEELLALRTRQGEVTQETRQIEEQRRGDDEDEERLTRLQRRTLARLFLEQRELSDKTERVRAELERDEAVAFVFALAQIRDDMAVAAERLGEEETGWQVGSLHAGIDHRLADLLAVLEDELERRRQALSQPQEEGAGEQSPPDGARPRLVPPVAELLLIQRMEFLALNRLEEFGRLHPELVDPDALGPLERGTLERWALEHAAVTELFRSLVQLPEEGEPPAAEAPSAEPQEGGTPESPEGGSPESPQEPRPEDGR